MSRTSRMSVFPEGQQLWRGIAFGTSQVAKPKDPEGQRKLQQENEKLRTEVDRLKALVELAQTPAPDSLSVSTLEVGKLKGQIAQMQRQMEIMDNELRTSNRRVVRYETMLDDVCSKVGKMEEQGADTSGSLKEWLQEVGVALKKRETSHCEDGQWERVDNVSVGGNRLIQNMGRKQISVSDTCDGSLLASPAARRCIHRLHEKLINLVPQVSRHSTCLQSILLPALQWMGGDLTDQIACDAESLASGLQDILGCLSDIAAVTPAQSLCQGEAHMVCSSVPGHSLEACEPEVEELITMLGPYVGEGDLHAVEGILAPVVFRYQRRYDTLVARLNRMHLDFKTVNQISETASKQHHAVLMLHRDVKSLSMEYEPEVLLALENLNEVIQAASLLVESPSEALVRHFIDVILVNMEGLRTVPEVLPSSVASFHKVVVEKVEALVGKLEADDGGEERLPLGDLNGGRRS